MILYADACIIIHDVYILGAADNLRINVLRRIKKKPPFELDKFEITVIVQTSVRGKLKSAYI